MCFWVHRYFAALRVCWYVREIFCTNFQFTTASICVVMRKYFCTNFQFTIASICVVLCKYFCTNFQFTLGVFSRWMRTVNIFRTVVRGSKLGVFCVTRGKTRRILLVWFIVIDGIWNSTRYATVLRCHLRQWNWEFSHRLFPFYHEWNVESPLRFYRYRFSI